MRAWIKSTQSNRANDKSVKMQSTKKLANSQQEATKVRSRVVDGSTRSTSNTSYCFSADDQACTSKGIRVHGLRSLDNWLWLCHGFIFRLYLCCIIVSMVIRWWLFLAQAESTSARFQEKKMNSQSPWSANAYREAHNGLYTEVPQAWWDYLRRYTTPHTYPKFKYYI